MSRKITSKTRALRSALAGVAVVTTFSLVSACAGAGTNVDPGSPLPTPVSEPKIDWQVIELETVETGKASSNSAFVAGDELWFSGTKNGTTFLYKTKDGINFTTQEVGWGVISEYAQIGATIVGVGRDGDNASIHLSVNGGQSWEILSPSKMQIANAEVWLESVTVHNNEFVAIGTARSKNWRTMLWTSADGKNWKLIDEYRDEHPTSATKIISDGTNLVLITAEHFCSTSSVNSSAGGWYLGSWVDYMRIRQGTTPNNLVKQSAAQNPLILEPNIDCNLISASALDDPAISFASATIHQGKIALATLLNKHEGITGQGVSLFDGKSWTLESNGVIGYANSWFMGGLLSLNERLALFWPSKSPSGSVVKNLAWQDHSGWVKFQSTQDEEVSNVRLAIEFQGHIYVWGAQFTPGGRAGDPMQWKVYRST